MTPAELQTLSDACDEVDEAIEGNGWDRLKDAAGALVDLVRGG
jgi:hypothetical protein